MKPRVVVIGAGIKGTAIAATISANSRYDCALVEKETVGSGATATNHGRLHLGTSGWRSDAPPLVARRMAGSRLLRRIPGALDNSERGHYVFFERSKAMEFQRFCQFNRIDYSTKNIPTLDNVMSCDDKVEVFSLDEFGFNPAVISARLLNSFIERGGTFYERTEVKKIVQTRGGLTVECSTRTIQADVVINASARWCTTISPSIPDQLMEWFEWRILCCRDDGSFDVNGVLAAVEENYGDPTVIPHQNWLTIDCKTPVLPRSSPELVAPSGRVCINLENPQDAELFRNTARRFPFVRTQFDKGALFSFAGLHGRIKNAKTGSSNCVREHPEIDGYWIAFGGQASTAILDALDSVGTIFGSDIADENFLCSVPALPRNGATPAVMSWERSA